MTTTIDPQRTRLLFTAVTVALGGYLLLSALSSQLPYILSGRSPLPGDVFALLVLQLLIALGALTLGWLVAPATPGRKLGAAALGIGLAIVYLIVATIRISPIFGQLFGRDALGLTMTIGNVHFMIAIAVGAGWLIVTASRGLSYLLLLIPVILIPVPYWMALANLSHGITQITLLVLTIIIVGAILSLSRLFVPRLSAVPA